MKEPKRKKKSKKHKKEKKKKHDTDELKEDKEDGEESENESDVECSVKPGEVPEIPSNKFLTRGERKDPVETNERSRQDDEDRRRDRREWGGHRNRSWNLDKDGRIVKGRGNVVYSASTFRRSRSRTPPHWKKELSKLKPLKSDQKDQNRRDHDRSDRHHGYRDRDYFDKVQSDPRHIDEKVAESFPAENGSSDESSTPERMPRIQSCVYRVDNSQKGNHGDQQMVRRFQENPESYREKVSPNSRGGDEG